MCPNNMVKVQPYGLYVVEPQLSDDEGSTEAAIDYPRKFTSNTAPLDDDVWMSMQQDFALDRHEDYEVKEIKAKRVPSRSNATPPPPMEEDVWMAMQEDFARDWRDEEPPKQAVTVKPKQTHKPVEYGDYLLF